VAKITAYKFVNPGLSAKSSPAVKAANQTTLAVNRLGVTVESIAKTISDLGTVSALKGKLELKQEIFDRRQKRLEKDAEAENQKESVDKKQVKKDEKSILKYGKKVGKGFFGILEDLLSPLVSILGSFGAFAITSNVLEYFADEENREKIVTFLEKTEFVFNKLSELAGNITETFQKGIDFVFGKETTLEQRLNALGRIAMAIGGIAGMITAAGGIRDLLDAGDSLTDVPDSSRTRGGDGPDGKPRKPPRPTRTNPSGIDAELEGPRGRLSASDVKQLYGDAAEKAYKKVLAERGEDAARVFLGELQNSGGSVTKAQQKFNRYVKKGKFPKIEPPRPGLLQRGLNLLGGVRDSAVKQGTRFRNFAVDQGGRLIKSLQGLPGWAVEQYNNMSAAARKKWEDVVKVGQKIKNRGTAIASAAGDKFKAAGNWIADGGKKFLDSASTGAKNFFMEKIVAPLKPIIDPVAKKASQIGQALYEALMKIPGAEKILGVLKKAGINGMGDIATAGGKLGKRAAAVLPVIGGIVNLLFAYDRAANGDSIGALIEGTSGILDIAGLATAGAGSVASMLLDGYMFARDFIPQLQQGEEAIVDAVGARGLKTQIDGILSKLPNLGEIVGKIMSLFGGGNYSSDESNAPKDAHAPEKAAGGVVPVSHADTGSGYTVQGVRDSYGRPAVFSRGGATAFGKMIQDSNGIVKGSDIASSKRSVSKNAAVGGVPNSNHLYGNALDIHGGSQTWMRSHGRKYGWVVQDYSGSHGGHFNYHGPGSPLPADNAGGGRRSGGGGGGGGSASVSSPFDPKAFIAFFKMIGVKDPVKSDKKDDETGKGNPPIKSVPVNTELMTGNISEQQAIAQAMKMVPIPVVVTSLVGMPTPVQINKSSGNVPGAPSSLSKRMS